jgi:antitoxin (DNA-binding transcriptional repressor) of toxin-antitoxin stability system
MNDITTTNLRTQSSKLVDTLKKGGVVSLIHRSKVIGVIKPAKEPKPLSGDDITMIKNHAKDLNLPKTSYEDREKIYSTHLSDKYGKDIS